MSFVLKEGIVLYHSSYAPYILQLGIRGCLTERLIPPSLHGLRRPSRFQSRRSVAPSVQSRALVRLGPFHLPPQVYPRPVLDTQSY